MKKARLIYTLVGLMAVFMFQSCDIKKANKIHKENTKVPQQSVNRMSRINGSVATNMQESFEQNALVKITENIAKNQKASYKIKADNFWAMMEQFSQQESDTLYFVPVQYTKNNHSQMGYHELSQFEDQLYLLYSFGENTSQSFDVYDLPAMNGKYYAFLDTKEIVTVKEQDASVMIKNYQTKIKPILQPAENTNYIKIYKEEIDKYSSIWKNSVVKPEYIILTWAQKPALSLLMNLNVDEETKRRHLKKYYPKRSVSATTEPNIGDQTTILTFVFDAEDLDGDGIPDLSDFDFNTTCPEVCP